jgi:hypothetical protein
MHPNCENEAIQLNQNTGSSLLELKQAYDDGLLVTTVTADMINDTLLSALFQDVPPANNLVH